jgi:hypothetical protein
MMKRMDVWLSSATRGGTKGRKICFGVKCDNLRRDEGSGNENMGSLALFLCDLW